LSLSLRSEKLVGRGEAAPTAFDAKLEMKVSPLDVSKALRVDRTLVSVRQLKAPSLAWFRRFIQGQETRLDGSGSMSMIWQDQRGSRRSGELALSLSGFSYARGALGLRLDAELRSAFEEPPDARLGFQRFRLDVKNAVVKLGGDHSEAWSGVALSNSLRVLDREPFALQGTFDLTVDHTKALVPLVLSKLPGTVVAHLLGLGKLEARTAIYLDENLQRVEVLNAHSGSLRLEGAWSKSAAGDWGAFLLRTGLANFGVIVRHGETDWTFAAASDFLRVKGPRK
jgi:hypothetical protein